MDTDAQRRLDQFLAEIGSALGNKRRRASFALYMQGLLGDGERKSVEPIAARAAVDPSECDPAHQRLLHFLVDSEWSDRDVRRTAVRYAMPAILQHEPIDSWIVDDTGFLKQGSHSVGVQRQYTGSAGKTANCQVGVSLSLATTNHPVPIDFELYLPRPWATVRARRREGRIPKSVRFKTKVELALQMIERAVEDGWPRGVMLADADYGRSSDFRDRVRQLGLDYAVAINAPTKLWVVDAQGRRRGDPLTAADLARSLAKTPKAFRRVTWREGTRRALSGRFAFAQVVAYHDDGFAPSIRPRETFVCEWPEGDTRPTKFYLARIDRQLSNKQLVRVIKQRWQTERVYQDLKGELGLDHYEGRRFPGWHHHVSAVLACYAFVTAERARSFFPSARRAPDPNSLAVTA